MTTKAQATVAPHCTLPPESLHDRIAWIREAVLPHASRSRGLEDAEGRVWIFEASEERRRQLERLVELERDCCRGSVTFALEEDPGQGELRLVLRGMDPLAENGFGR